MTSVNEQYRVIISGLGGKGTAEFFDFPFLEAAQECAETYHKMFNIEVGVYRLIYKREKK